MFGNGALVLWVYGTTTQYEWILTKAWGKPRTSNTQKYASLGVFFSILRKKSFTPVYFCITPNTYTGKSEASFYF